MTDLSFIIPFYKGEMFIENAVSSIIKAYSFSNFNKELVIEMVVVVDSVETDTLKLTDILFSIIKNKFKLTVHRNLLNEGVAKSRNTGIGIAQGEFILCLDQDDAITVDFFKVLIHREFGNYDFIICNGIFQFHQPVYDIKIYYIKPRVTLKNLILYDIIRSPGQVVVKKAMLEKCPFPSPQKYFGADDKFCWISLFGTFSPKVLYIDETVYIGNMHASNFSNDHKQLYYCVLELWEQFIKQGKLSKPMMSIIQRNIDYCKFQTNTAKEIKSKCFGFYQFLCYHLRPNKLISFLVKKLSSLKAYSN